MAKILIAIYFLYIKYSFFNILQLDVQEPGNVPIDFKVLESHS
jgi:hypothetical protein